MLNKVQKNFKKLNEKKESTQLEKKIRGLIMKQGGYSREQQLELIDLQTEYKKELEELKVRSLKKNLEILIKSYEKETNNKKSKG